MGERHTTIRVLIVAAYASVRAGLHLLLTGAEDCSVVGEVSGSGQLERVLAETASDVVLYDETEGDGARVRDVLTDRDIGLVVLDDAPLPIPPIAALPGFALLRKDSEANEIICAVRAVAAGLIVLDRTLAPLLSASLPVTIRLTSETVSAGETLTAREREVLQLMAQGLPNKQIAARLGISPHTAKFHVAAILAKLGATSRTEAVALGARRGDVLL